MRSLELGVPDEVSVRLAKQFRYFADDDRYLILSVLHGRPVSKMTNGEISDHSGLAAAVVNHHLRVLVEARLVDISRDSAQARYGINKISGDLLRFLDKITRRGVAEVEDGRNLRALMDELEHVSGVDAVSAPSEFSRASIAKVVDTVSRRLVARYDGIYSSETVQRVLCESQKIFEFGGLSKVEALSRMESLAADRLDCAARVSGILKKTRPEVLFVCIHNSGRSQMGAGILRHYVGDRVNVRSAGSSPSGSVDEGVRRGLEEIGVSIAGEFPKPLTDEIVRSADFVITMGCGDACPVYPGKAYMDWEISDPQGQPISLIRTIRDEIEKRIIETLLPAVRSYLDSSKTLP